MILMSFNAFGLILAFLSQRRVQKGDIQPGASQARAGNVDFS